MWLSSGSADGYSQDSVPHSSGEKREEFDWYLNSLGMADCQQLPSIGMWRVRAALGQCDVLNHTDVGKCGIPDGFSLRAEDALRRREIRAKPRGALRPFGRVLKTG